VKHATWIILTVLLAALGAAGPVLAKQGHPGKIILDGPDLAAPLESTDPQALDLFGDEDVPITAYAFVDGTHTLSQPPVGPAYRLTLFRKSSAGTFDQYYALAYYPDPTGGPGFVHDYYVAGTASWYSVSAAGETLMQRLLPNARYLRNETRPASPATSGMVALQPWLVLAVSLVALGLISVRRRQTMRNRR